MSSNKLSKNHKILLRSCSFKMLVSRFLCVNIGSVVGQQPLRLELQKASEAAAEAHLKDRSRLLHWEEKLGKNAGKMT